MADTMIVHSKTYKVGDVTIAWTQHRAHVDQSYIMWGRSAV